MQTAGKARQESQQNGASSCRLSREPTSVGTHQAPGGTEQLTTGHQAPGCPEQPGTSWGPLSHPIRGHSGHPPLEGGGTSRFRIEVSCRNGWPRPSRHPPRLQGGPRASPSAQPRGASQQRPPFAQLPEEGRSPANAGLTDGSVQCVGASREERAPLRGVPGRPW